METNGHGQLAFLVDAGVTYAGPDGGAPVAMSDEFRIAAPGPAAAETAAVQLVKAAAGRRRRVVHEAWARVRADAAP
ncbi:MAG: hypothetical protein QOI62_1819 [Solirubrobacteraceae bacterium]|nr:hypothetical protein [Solirubrobacteraceae bacterium]MEA2276244.1 hypothetical protein [Solirubrobacteraceae bacterium]MEA2358559.1 hypothetical protein [Solirubrobacteraceae bacterium]